MMRTYWWAIQNLLDPAGAERRSMRRLTRATDQLAAAMAWYGYRAKDAWAAIEWLLEDVRRKRDAANEGVNEGPKAEDRT